MADIAEVQIYHVEAWSHGVDKYLGIESLELRRIVSRVLWFRSELELVPDSVQKIGHDEAPVTFTLRSRALSSLKALVDLAKADVTVKCKKGSDATAVTLTLKDVIYTDTSLSTSRDAKGFFSVQGVATDVTSA
jgi:hypothetical protein